MVIVHPDPLLAGTTTPTLRRALYFTQKNFEKTQIHVLRVITESV